MFLQYCTRITIDELKKGKRGILYPSNLCLCNNAVIITEHFKCCERSIDEHFFPFLYNYKSSFSIATRRNRTLCNRTLYDYLYSDKVRLMRYSFHRLQFLVLFLVSLFLARVHVYDLLRFVFLVVIHRSRFLVLQFFFDFFFR